jgi:hypothetical protein
MLWKALMPYRSGRFSVTPCPLETQEPATAGKNAAAAFHAQTAQEHTELKAG